jgi:molybdopterin-guanine dinucleotide biosynthesis protein A
VLAGGRSRRLGVDKTGLRLVRHGFELTLVEWAARRLAPWCEGVVVAGPPGLAPHGLRAVADGPAPGPAGGLLGAARAAPGRPLLVLACDLPWLPANSLGRLTAAARAGGVGLALFRSAGGLEPLCAWWGPRSLARLAARCASGDPSLWSLAEEPGIDCAVLDGEALGAEAFFNLNRPDDLERFLAREARQEARPGARLGGRRGDQPEGATPDASSRRNSKR